MSRRAPDNKLLWETLPKQVLEGTLFDNFAF